MTLIQENNLPAGNYSAWLQENRRNQESQTSGSDVPCGTCTGCCRSSLFIHVKPTETETLAHIPRALLFPAPGLPKGHMLMGYDSRGHCPMLKDDKCSIYLHRPQTCRDFDCRIFPATGIELAEETKAPIAERAHRWQFSFPEIKDEQERNAVYAAASFLRKHRADFAPDELPSNPTQLAALAIRVYQVFLPWQQVGGQSPPSSEIVSAIVKALRKHTTTASQEKH